MALVNVPGTSRIATIGGDPHALWEMDGGLYAVVNKTAYAISPQGSASALGSVAVSGRCGVAHDGTRALLAGGGRSYQVTASGVTEITDPDCPAGTEVTYHNGYFLKSVAGSNEFRASSIDDPTTWSPTDNAFERQVPGNVVAPFSDSGELMLFKDRAIGFWFESGAASGIPFDRTPQLVLQTGCASAGSIVSADNRVFFLAQEDSGGVYAAVLEGRQVRRISTEDIDFQLRSADSSCRAYHYGLEGHTFYAVTCPTGTFVYDAATQAWHDRAGFGSTQDVNVAVTRAYGRTYALGVDGHIHEMDNGLYTHNGAAIIRERVTPEFSMRGRSFAISRVSLDLDTGISDNPEVTIEVSEDHGRTFRNRHYSTATRTGDYVHRVYWTGLGAYRSAVFRIRQTDNSPTAWRNLRLEFRVGR